MKSNVLPRENNVFQHTLIKYIQTQSYRQPPILNAMHNSDQQTQAPLLTPDKNSTLYSNELHRFQSFQSFQNQLESQLRSKNYLQTQLHSFLSTATKSLEAALRKLHSTHEPSDQPMGNLVVD